MKIEFVLMLMDYSSIAQIFPQETAVKLTTIYVDNVSQNAERNSLLCPASDNPTEPQTQYRMDFKCRFQMADSVTQPNVTCKHMAALEAVSLPRLPLTVYLSAALCRVKGLTENESSVSRCSYVCVTTSRFF